MTTTTPEVEMIARLRDDDTDPVMLRQAADLITALIEDRAGQSHAAGLLACAIKLRAVADWLPHPLCVEVIDMADKAIAAAKGTPHD